MDYKVFSDNVDIAITGGSQAGKSTFISSLFKENVRGELLNLTSKNVGKGQTKIPTYYGLQSSNTISSLKLLKISFNQEGVEEYISKTYKKLDKIQKDNVIVELFIKLGLYNLRKEDNTIDFEKVEEEINKEHDFLKILQLKDVSSFINKFINNELLVNENIQIINHIEIIGPASDYAYDIMEKYKFTKVVLRDSRGWLDEPANKAKRLIKSADQKQDIDDENKNVEEVEKELFDERGLSGAKACIIMNGQGNAVTDMISNMYGSLIKQAVTSMPVFLVERNAILEHLLSTDSSIEEYTKLMKDEKICGHNFKSIKEVLNDVGLFTDTKSSIGNLAKKHYKELLLVDSYNLENAESYNIYLNSVNFVFEKVLKELYEFRKTLDKSFNFVKDNSDKLVSAFVGTFNNEFINEVYFDKRVNQWDNKLVCDKYLYSIASKILNYKHYYGEILGPRKGITIYENGDYRYGIAIAILRTAHNIISNIVEGILKNTKIMENVESILEDNNQRQIAIDNMYVLFKNYLRDRYYDTQCNATLGKLAPRYILIGACNYIRDIYNKNINFHYGYFNNSPELEYEEQWKEGQKNLSTMYAVISYFISEFLSNTCKVSMNEYGEIVTM